MDSPTSSCSFCSAFTMQLPPYSYLYHCSFYWPSSTFPRGGAYFLEGSHSIRRWARSWPLYLCSLRYSEVPQGSGSWVMHCLVVKTSTAGGCTAQARLLSPVPVVPPFGPF